MEFNYNNQYDPQVQAEPISRYTAKTFGWMFLGLITTFFVAMTGYLTPVFDFVILSPYGLIVLFGLELLVVWQLSAKITKLSLASARMLFFVYSMLNGVFFTSVFIAYAVDSLVFVFALTSLYFGAMAAYGYFTKADLTRIKPVLVFGVIFLILFQLFAMFFNLTAFDTGICILGIVLFLAITAYDTQKIKYYYEAFSTDPEMLKKASIFSALQLYLDFINLFIYLLRLIGKKK